MTCAVQPVDRAIPAANARSAQQRKARAGAGRRASRASYSSSAVTDSQKPVVIYQGSLAIAKDLERVLQKGEVRASLVPLPGGG